jgi:hypothetical protein
VDSSPTNSNSNSNSSSVLTPAGPRLHRRADASILGGSIEPGKVFDVTTDLDGVPAGHQDMADRKSLKVLVPP